MITRPSTAQLVEVVRRECEVRIEQVELQIAGASSAEDVVACLVESFEEYLRELIVETLSEESKDSWWEKVPKDVKDYVAGLEATEPPAPE